MVNLKEVPPFYPEPALVCLFLDSSFIIPTFSVVSPRQDGETDDLLPFLALIFPRYSLHDHPLLGDSVVVPRPRQFPFSPVLLPSTSGIPVSEWILSAKAFPCRASSGIRRVSHRLSPIYRLRRRRRLEVPVSPLSTNERTSPFQLDFLTRRSR